MERKTIGKYRILRTLGAGGMGVVYEAEDERLGRRVALKTIHEHIDDPTSRERLWREARAAAVLTHPGICRIYDVGEEGGRLYLAMELLEGESLATRLERGGLPLPEALAVMDEVLQALQALHDAGLVHRDLKPSNVHLTPHGARLLDFGLARPVVADADTEARLTRTGVILGTPGFMAPEQWRGEEVGPPADVFAAGALLFELGAGRPAFQGRTPLDLYHAVVHEAPPNLCGGPVVEELDRLVRWALAREPEARPLSAGALAEELRAVAARAHGRETPVVLSIHRLLVLPFQLLPPDPGLEFLSVGLADALCTSLSGHEGLVVKPGSPQQALAVARLDLESVALESGAMTALSGSLFHANGRLRASAQLRALPGGEIRWAEQAEGSLDDLFALQDSLARHLADRLAVRITPRPGALQQDVPATPAAYEAYLRANQMAFRVGKLAAAQSLYEECLREDPDYAPAWARLGRIYRVRAKYGEGDVEEGRRLSLEAFERALALNPHLPAAHYLFAYYEIEEQGRTQDAMKRLLVQARRAPTMAELFAGLVLACRFCGLLDPSLQAARRASRLDPGIRSSVAYTCWMRGEYEEALRRDDEDLGWMECYVPALVGRPEEALAACRDREARAPTEGLRAMFASTHAAHVDDRARCERGYEVLRAAGFHDQEGLYFMCRNLARVGSRETALECLAGIVDRGFTCPQVMRQDPWLESLRGDPRFGEILERAREGRRSAAQVYAEAGGAALLGPVEACERP